MKIFELSDAQRARLGFSHRFEITYADLTAAAATQTLDLFTYTAGMGVTNAAAKLVSGWVGASITAVTFEAGWNGATTDDPNGIIEAYEVATAGTELLYQDGTGAAFATKRTGYYPLDAGVYTCLFTATGANIGVNTAGEIHLYLNIVDINKG
jgi:hypothetical protein